MATATTLLDTAIVGGTLVTSSGRRPADLGIREGRVACVAAPGHLPPAARRIAAAGRYVLPGLIDPHTHPGNTAPLDTDIGPETLSAAIGGVTTINAIIKSTRMVSPFRELPTPADAISYRQAFPPSRVAVDALATVDVVFTFVIMTDGHANEIPVYMRELGVTSFKFFPGAPPNAPWGPRVGIPVFPDDGTLYVSYRHLAELGGMAMLHCENQQVTRILEPEVRAAGGQGLPAWAAKSPPAMEACEIWRAAFFARLLRCPMYVVHLSSGAGAAALSAARAHGAPMIGETCPQYLVEACDDPRSGLMAKMSPPVHTLADQDSLWQGLGYGAIQTVGSDHVPGPRAKKLGGGDVWKATPGGPGVATLLPLLISEGVHRGRLTLEQVVAVTSLNPALALGLYPRKGNLDVGADADLVLVDLDLTRQVDAADLHSTADYSPWEGRSLRGWPVLTMVRGEVVMRDGHPTGARPGRYLERDAPVRWAELTGPARLPWPAQPEAGWI